MASHWPALSSFRKESGLGIRHFDEGSTVELMDYTAQKTFMTPGSTFVPSEPSPNNESQPFVSVDYGSGLPVPRGGVPWSSPALTLHSSEKPLPRSLSLRSLKLTTRTPDQHCKSNQSFRHPRFNCRNVLLLLLTAYSTVLSGVWLVVALWKPHYDSLVKTSSFDLPSLASVLTAAVAKTIELSFVAVFIAFLGQYLSRKALKTSGGGVSIADMQLRTLILQPGAVMTHFNYCFRAWKSLLGIVAFVACLSAMFYTTASDALGGWVLVQ